MLSPKQAKRCHIHRTGHDSIDDLTEPFSVSGASVDGTSNAGQPLRATNGGS